jgi:hypothetical protein
MSNGTVIKSFADLPSLLRLDDLTDETPPDPPAAGRADPPPDLTTLLAELETASSTLATIARQDQEARALALRDLEQYDALVELQRQADHAHAHAQAVRQDAEALAAGAFADETRRAADRVVRLAAQAEAVAARLAEERRTAVTQLAAGLDLQRLLAERRRQEEAAHARAAEAERARRLHEVLAGARAALAAGDLEEARTLLGPAGNENPDNADIASLVTIIAQREFAVKATAAETALRTARRLHRHQPVEALTVLEALDVVNLPPPLARQIFGTWAQACVRLCRARGIAAPLRYAPDPGRGAVLAADDAGRYTVLRALSMGHGWAAGTTVGDHIMQRARPLR